VSEPWLKTGKGEVFDTGKDPRLERIISNFNKLPPQLQDYLFEYLDWLSAYHSKHAEIPFPKNVKDQSQKR